MSNPFSDDEVTIGLSFANAGDRADELQTYALKISQGCEHTARGLAAAACVVLGSDLDRSAGFRAVFDAAFATVGVN